MARRIPTPAAPSPEQIEETSWFDEQVKSRIVVHTTSDLSLDGVLVMVARDGLLIRAARLLGDEKPTPLAGEVFVPREQIAFAQSPG